MAKPKMLYGYDWSDGTERVEPEPLRHPTPDFPFKWDDGLFHHKPQPPKPTPHIRHQETSKSNEVSRFDTES